MLAHKESYDTSNSMKRFIYKGKQIVRKMNDYRKNRLYIVEILSMVHFRVSIFSEKEKQINRLPTELTNLHKISRDLETDVCA